jgi:O-antigen/teichoic acid export membrane protein
MVRNSASLLASRFIDMTAAMLINVIMARYLGAALFGQYAFISAYVVSVAIISYFGLDNIAIRDIAKHPDKARQYLGAVIAARWIMSALAALLIFAGLPFIGLEREFFPALALLTAAELANAFATVQTAVFRAKEQMRYEVHVTIFGRVVSLTLVTLAAWQHFTLTGLCAALFLANLSRGLLAAWISRNRFFKPDFSEVNVLLKGIFKDAFTMGAAVLITNWLFRSAQMAIKFLIGPEAVAYFQVSHAIILQVSTVAMSIAAALFPVISKKAGGDQKNMRRVAEIYSGAANLLICLGLLFSVGLILLAKPIVLLLFGPEYADAVEVFQLLSTALVPIFIYSLHILMFSAYNKQHYAIASRGVCLVLACCLYALFVPQAGVLGAACAYVLVSACIGLAEALLLRSKVVRGAQPPLETYFLNLLLTAGMSASFILGYSWTLRAGLLLLILIAVSLQLKGVYTAVTNRRMAAAKI